MTCAKKPLKLIESQYTGLCDEHAGLCFDCGAVKHGECEPDAERYECDDCGAHAVYGIEQALLYGAVIFTDEPNEDL